MKKVIYTILILVIVLLSLLVYNFGDFASGVVDDAKKRRTAPKVVHGDTVLIELQE